MELPQPTGRGLTGLIMVSSEPATLKEKIRIVQWILRNFDVNRERREVQIPIGDGENLWLPIKDVYTKLKTIVHNAFLEDVDPLFAVAQLSLRKEIMDHVKQRIREKWLKGEIPFSEEMIEWLK